MLHCHGSELRLQLGEQQLLPHARALRCQASKELFRVADCILQLLHSVEQLERGQHGFPRQPMLHCHWFELWLHLGDCLGDQQLQHSVRNGALCAIRRLLCDVRRLLECSLWHGTTFRNLEAFQHLLQVSLHIREVALVLLLCTLQHPLHSLLGVFRFEHAFDDLIHAHEATGGANLHDRLQLACRVK